MSYAPPLKERLRLHMKPFALDTGSGYRIQDTDTGYRIRDMDTGYGNVKGMEGSSKFPEIARPRTETL